MKCDSYGTIDLAKCLGDLRDYGVRESIVSVQRGGTPIIHSTNLVSDRAPRS
jgi:hypothetical protein